MVLPISEHMVRASAIWLKDITKEDITWDREHMQLPVFRPGENSKTKWLSVKDGEMLVIAPGNSVAELDLPLNCGMCDRAEPFIAFLVGVVKGTTTQRQQVLELMNSSQFQLEAEFLKRIHAKVGKSSTNERLKNNLEGFTRDAWNGARPRQVTQV